MAVFRVHKIKNFTSVSNYLIKDERLSLKDKGMMLVLLSLPDNWNFSVKGLETICKEARNTINSILNDLEKNGYLERTRVYENRRIKEWRYDIYEIPKCLYRKNEDIKNEDINFEDIKNETQLNTKESKKEKSSTKKDIYKEIITRVIKRLNELNGTKYSTTSESTIKFIKGRLDEGYTEEDLTLVVEKMSYLWNQPSQKDMRQYLRPSTLFRPTNFENYLNMPVQEQSRTLNNANIDIDDFIKKGERK